MYLGNISVLTHEDILLFSFLNYKVHIVKLINVKSAIWCIFKNENAWETNTWSGLILKYYQILP